MSTVPTETIAETFTDADGTSEVVLHCRWDVPLGQVEAERVDDGPWHVWLEGSSVRDFTAHEAVRFADALLQAALFVAQQNVVALPGAKV